MTVNTSVGKFLFYFSLYFFFRTTRRAKTHVKAYAPSYVFQLLKSLRKYLVTKRISQDVNF